MDFQQFAYNRNDNHPMMPQVKMEPGIKLEPLDNMPPQLDGMMQQIDRMASPQMTPHLDGLPPQQQQYPQQMQQQQQYNMQQQQQQQQYPMGMGMPPHGMPMNMGPTGAAGQQMGMMNGMPPGGGQVPVMPPVVEEKKKGRKKKLKQEKLTDNMKEKKPRRKFDRFHGMPEEEVVKRTLPDLLVHNLDIVIVGINPGLMAAYKGHHYAGPGNHFWKCLYLSGMIPEPMTCMDDERLKDFGIGFTNIVERTTRGSADLTRKEIKEGAKILSEKMQIYKPLIACFNGKGIYEIFSGKKDFEIGRQPETIPNTDTVIYVMPSSSARCSQFPRAQDKVKFYLTLKELRNDLKGIPNEPRPPEYEEGAPPIPTIKQLKEKEQKIKKEAQQQQAIKQEQGLYNANQQGLPQQQQQGMSPQQQMQMPQLQQQQQQQQQQGVQIKQEPGLYNSNPQGCPQQQMPPQQQQQHMQQPQQQMPQQQQQHMQQQQQQQMGMQQMAHQQQMQMQQQQQMRQHYQQPPVHIKQEPGLYDVNQVCPQQQAKMQPGMRPPGMSTPPQPGMSTPPQPGMSTPPQPGMPTSPPQPGMSTPPPPQPGMSTPPQGMQQQQPTNAPPPQGMSYYNHASHPTIKQEPLDRFSPRPGVCSQYPSNNSYPQQYAHNPMPNIKQEPGMNMMGMGHFMDGIPNISSAGATRVTNVQSMGNQGSPSMGHPQMGPSAGSPAGMGQPSAHNQGTSGSPGQNSGDIVPSFGEAFQYMNSTEGLPPT